MLIYKVNEVKQNPFVIEYMVFTCVCWKIEDESRLIPVENV